MITPTSSNRGPYSAYASKPDVAVSDASYANAMKAKTTNGIVRDPGVSSGVIYVNQKWADWEKPEKFLEGSSLTDEQIAELKSKYDLNNMDYYEQQDLLQYLYKHGVISEEDLYWNDYSYNAMNVPDGFTFFIPDREYEALKEAAKNHPDPLWFDKMLNLYAQRQLNGETPSFDEMMKFMDPTAKTNWYDILKARYAEINITPENVESSLSAKSSLERMLGIFDLIRRDD